MPSPPPLVPHESLAHHGRAVPVRRRHLGAGPRGVLKMLTIGTERIVSPPKLDRFVQAVPSRYHGNQQPHQFREPRQCPGRKPKGRGLALYRVINSRTLRFDRQRLRPHVQAEAADLANIIPFPTKPRTVRMAVGSQNEFPIHLDLIVPAALAQRILKILKAAG